MTFSSIAILLIVVLEGTWPILNPNASTISEIIPPKKQHTNNCLYFSYETIISKYICRKVVLARNLFSDFCIPISLIAVLASSALYTRYLTHVECAEPSLSVKKKNECNSLLYMILTV